MVFDKMAAIYLSGFRILDPIQNLDHLQLNLFLIIKNLDQCVFQIPTAFEIQTKRKPAVVAWVQTVCFIRSVTVHQWFESRLRTRLYLLQHVLCYMVPTLLQTCVICIGKGLSWSLPMHRGCPQRPTKNCNMYLLIEIQTIEGGQKEVLLRRTNI